MDKMRRKELQLEWKNRHPEMGIISVRCSATGEIFLGTSKDTRASFNSNRMKLSTRNHPNKQLQAMWNQYGEDAFEWSVYKLLKYENPEEDQTEKLPELLEQCLEEMPQAGKIWK